MPLYDYQCESCKAAFEVKLSFAEADNAQPTCPACGSSQVRRRIGRVLVKRGKSANRLTNEQMSAALGYAQALGGPNLDGGISGGHSHEGHSHED